MPMTIPKYAENRGISRQAVYNALEKNPDIEAKTYMGKSNGKDAKYLSDEAIGMLDQTIKLPYAFTEATTQEQRMIHVEEENRLLKAQNLIRDKLERVQECLSDEVVETRRQLLEQSSASHKELLELIENQNSDAATRDDMQKLYDKLESSQTTINKLLEELQKKDEEIKSLQAELDQSREEVRKYHKSVFGLYKKD